MILFPAILAILGAYLLGSVPTAYLAGRLLKGMDIRSLGSGNVGGANVWQVVSRRVSLLVTICDVLKGTLAVFIAQVLGLGTTLQVVAGLTVVIGHNWSVFLRFSGGRGIASTLGVLILLAPKELLIFCGIAILGLLVWSVPVGVGLGIASLPLASWGFGEPLPLTLGCLGLFAIMLTKRLAITQDTSYGDWKRVILYRLLFDRDTRDRQAWIHRSLAEKSPPPETDSSLWGIEGESAAKDEMHLSS